MGACGGRLGPSGGRIAAVSTAEQHLGNKTRQLSQHVEIHKKEFVNTSQATPSQGESYSLEHTTRVQAFFAKRTAQEHAGFFLPHLEPGMNLLDCGCGPGAITIDLAGAVAPGKVIGIDLQQSQIDEARTLAERRGVNNVSFEVGNVYELPFPDATFDAVFANALLQHLRNPLDALKEMRRVLKPGGVAGVRDPLWGRGVCAPSTPLLREFHKLRLRVIEHNGGSPRYAVRQRRLLLDAGFVRTEALGSATSSGTLAGTRMEATHLTEILRGPTRVSLLLEQGWADQAKVDAMIAELEAWGERPDALYITMWCAALGWVPEQE